MNFSLIFIRLQTVKRTRRFNSSRMRLTHHLMMILVVFNLSLTSFFNFIVKVALLVVSVMKAQKLKQITVSYKCQQSRVPGFELQL